MAIPVVRLRRPLDQPTTLTHFRDLGGHTKSERTLARFRDLAEVIDQARAEEKKRVPLLSFVCRGWRCPRPAPRPPEPVRAMSARQGRGPPHTGKPPGVMIRAALVVSPAADQSNQHP